MVIIIMLLIENIYNTVIKIEVNLEVTVPFKLFRLLHELLSSHQVAVSID